MADEQTFRGEPGLLGGRRGACPSRHETAGHRRTAGEESASRQRAAHVLLPSPRGHHGNATVKPAVPPHSSALRLMPWRRPTSNESPCKGGATSTSQMAPTRALLEAVLPRTASPFTSAATRRGPC